MDFYADPLGIYAAAALHGAAPSNASTPSTGPARPALSRCMHGELAGSWMQVQTQVPSLVHGLPPMLCFVAAWLRGSKGERHELDKVDAELAANAAVRAHARMLAQASHDGIQVRAGACPGGLRGCHRGSSNTLNYTTLH